MTKAITQIEAYGYQEVIKSWSTNHSKIKTVISNCQTSRTSCYQSNLEAHNVQHHWVWGRALQGDPCAGYKSHVVACGEDNLVFMTSNITNTLLSAHSHLLHSTGRGRGWGVFWLVRRIYISVEQSVSVMLREASSFNISAAQLACYDNEHCRGHHWVRPHHKVTGGFFTLFYVISGEVSWQPARPDIIFTTLPPASAHRHN